MPLQISNERYLYYYSKRPSEFVGCCALWKIMKAFKTDKVLNGYRTLKLLVTEGQLLILVLQIETQCILGEPGTEGHRNKPLTDYTEAFHLVYTHTLLHKPDSLFWWPNLRNHQYSDSIHLQLPPRNTSKHLLSSTTGVHIHVVLFHFIA